MWTETQTASYREMCFIIMKYLCYAISLHFTFQTVELRTQQRGRRSKRRNKFSLEHRSLATSQRNGQSWDSHSSPSPPVSKSKCGGNHLVSHDVCSGCFQERKNSVWIRIVLFSSCLPFKPRLSQSRAATPPLPEVAIRAVPSGTWNATISPHLKKGSEHT